MMHVNVTTTVIRKGERERDRDKQNKINVYKENQHLPAPYSFNNIARQRQQQRIMKEENLYTHTQTHTQPHISISGRKKNPPVPPSRRTEWNIFGVAMWENEGMRVFVVQCWSRDVACVVGKGSSIGPYTRINTHRHTLFLFLLLLYFFFLFLL